MAFAPLLPRLRTGLDFFTDRLGGWVSENLRSLTFLQTAKGGFFIFLSSAFIFILTKRVFDRIEAEPRERVAVSRKTVEGAHPILRNYPNQMQIVTLEAEQSRDFDQAMLRLARKVSDEAAAELTKLDGITTYTFDHIAAVFYRDRRKDAPPVADT